MEIVRFSLTRMAYLMKLKGSKSGFLEDLVDLDHLNSATSKFNGILSENEKITLNFMHEQKDLLKKISFGLYGIVHPLDYNPVTGIWKNVKKIIASGSYRVEEWTDDNIRITNRNVSWFSQVLHPLKSINFISNQDFENSDLIMASSYANFDQRFAFMESKDTEIRYLRVFNWKDENHPFSNRKFRVFLRSEFYKQLEKNKFKTFNFTRSFFPLTIRNIQENKDTDVSDFKLDSRSFSYEFRVRNSLPELEKTENSNKLGVVKSIHKAIDEVLNNWDLKFKRLNDTPMFVNKEDNGKHLDIGTLATGILLEDPDNDIRFMFLSKEGIQLPDSTGEIHKLLKESPLNIQRINELLWEQAIIWPVAHYGSGLWAKKDQFDFLQLNMTLPPTNFQWIGLK